VAAPRNNNTFSNEAKVDQGNDSEDDNLKEAIRRSLIES